MKAKKKKVRKVQKKLQSHSASILTNSCQCMLPKPDLMGTCEDCKKKVVMERDGDVGYG